MGIVAESLSYDRSQLKKIGIALNIQQVVSYKDINHDRIPSSKNYQDQSFLVCSTLDRSMLSFL